MKFRDKVAAGLIALLVVSGLPVAANADADDKNAGFSVVGGDSRASLISRTDANEKLATKSLSPESRNASDAELVAFLLLAKGPIADRNPEAVAVAESQIPALESITDAQALEASQEYVDASSVFSTEIRTGLLSDNPIHVQAAIDAFGVDFLAYIEANSANATNAARGLVAQASGCDGSWCVKQTALAVTTAAVVWQIAGLHTAAAVTIVLGAAVFVYLPGETNMNDVDGQRFVADFMSNIRA